MYKCRPQTVTPVQLLRRVSYVCRLFLNSNSCILKMYWQKKKKKKKDAIHISYMDSTLCIDDAVFARSSTWFSSSFFRGGSDLCDVLC